MTAPFTEPRPPSDPTPYPDQPPQPDEPPVHIVNLPPDTVPPGISVDNPDRCAA